MSAERDSLAGLSRENLAQRTVAVLNRGGYGNPDVLLVRAGEREVVVKDYRPRAGWVRATIGRLVTAREVAIYRVLEGAPAVPRLLGRVDALAFALEYRPGTRISRQLAGVVSPSFVQDLAAAIDDIHARGVVHLDLRHRGNMLMGDDGHPVLIDFATALRFRPGGLGAKLLLPILREVDRAAYRKWRVRLVAQDCDSSGVAPNASDGARGASRPT